VLSRTQRISLRSNSERAQGWGVATPLGLGRGGALAVPAVVAGPALAERTNSDSLRLASSSCAQSVASSSGRVAGGNRTPRLSQNRT
jgi:hypothetical protein